MIDFTTIEELEKTQDLPLLTPDLLLEDALSRERSARMEVLEITRHNARQAKEIARLRGHRDSQLPRSAAAAETGDRLQTEETLFEVCGALKAALSKVLSECQMRSVSLSSAITARRILDESCDKLERILSAPGFAKPEEDRADIRTRPPATPTPKAESLAVDLKSFVATQRVPPARLSRLRVDWS